MGSPYRVLITGWRAWPEANKDFIWRELYGLWTRVPTDMGEYIPPESIMIVHGKCPYGGVDLWAEQWAKTYHQLWDPHPADWDKYGKPAGNIRNTEMVALGADLCIGFPGPGSKGTWDCLQKATNAGIETYSRSWFDPANVTGAQLPTEEQLRAF
jgi:hypothetical protein